MGAMSGWGTCQRKAFCGLSTSSCHPRWVWENSNLPGLLTLHWGFSTCPMPGSDLSPSHKFWAQLACGESYVLSVPERPISGLGCGRGWWSRGKARRRGQKLPVPHAATELLPLFLAFSGFVFPQENFAMNLSCIWVTLDLYLKDHFLCQGGPSRSPRPLAWD